MTCAKKVMKAYQCKSRNLLLEIQSLPKKRVDLTEVTNCCIYRTNRFFTIVLFNSKHGNVKFVSEETHYTGETELRQSDEVQILWNTDVLCCWGWLSTIGCFSIRQHLRSTVSPLLQTVRKTTHMDIISEWDQQRMPAKCDPTCPILYPHERCLKLTTNVWISI